MIHLSYLCNESMDLAANCEVVISLTPTIIKQPRNLVKIAMYQYDKIYMHVVQNRNVALFIS